MPARSAILAAAILLVGATLLAQEATKPAPIPERSDRFTVSDLFNMQYAAEPQISPDGKRVVYVRQFSDIMSDKRCSNLWIINSDGTESRPLTTGCSSDSSPRWSPDGTRLAYLSDREGHLQVWVRWMDTGQTARVTNVLSPPSAISWSPDGKQLVFASMVEAKELNIGVMPKAPQGAKWEEAPTAYDRSIYRFNGAGYLKPGYTHIFVISAEGGVPRQITGGNYQHGGAAFGSSEPVWTPDGKYLLLSVNRHEDYEYNPRDTEIYEFSVADGTARALTNRRGPDGSPAISPDGKKIAYIGFDDKFQGYQVAELYVMDRDGANPHAVSTGLDRDARSPRWAADGSGIYLLYDDQGVTKLGFYPAAGGALKTLAENIGSGGSAYGAGASFTLAKNGAFATTRTTASEPGDIAVGTPAKPGLRAITNVNQDLLAQRKLGEVEEIWFNASNDNRKVEGWVIKPPDYKPGQRYPTILEIHGGPFANYGPRFDIEKQIMAAAGYVVLYVNPRGSTSYGEQFGNLIHHAYPGDDFYDLNSGVDAVVAKGYADPKQLFVTGGSGGGVLTCWMIGRSTRFRAAASLYPVIDWYSFALTSDIPIVVVRYWFPGNPWDYPEQYMKRSVISLVKNVKTPTLLMTGESDFRTPIGQAEEYYEALKLLQVPSVLVRVPDEPHGISRHPSHHVAKMVNVLGWFEQHRIDAKDRTPQDLAAE